MRSELEVGFVSRAFVLDVMTLLQSCCEGHNQQMQDFLRDQPQEVFDIDLVTESFHFLAVAETEVDVDNIDQLRQCLNTLVEFLQGNISRGNASTLVDAKCIELLGRMMLGDSLRGELQDEVRSSVATLLSAMLEGNNEPVRARMKATLDLEAMFKLCNDYFRGAQTLKQLLAADGVGVSQAVHALASNEETDEAEGSNNLQKRMAMRTLRQEVMLSTGFTLYLLVADLCDQTYTESKDEESDETDRSALFKVLDEDALRYYGAHTAHIEIINSQGELERVIFSYPPFCMYLTDESKRTLVEGVDRDTPGRIIFDFFERSDVLHAEMKHLAKLEEVRLWRWLVWYKPYAVSSLFVNALILNILVVGWDALEKSSQLLKPEGCRVYGQSFNLTECTFIDSGWKQLHTVLVVLIRCFGLVQTMSAVTVFLLYAMQSGPVRQDVCWRAATKLSFAEAKEQAGTSFSRRMRFLIMSTYYLFKVHQLGRYGTGWDGAAGRGRVGWGGARRGGMGQGRAGWGGVGEVR